MNKNIAYKFVQNNIRPLESLNNSFEYRMKVKLLNKEKLTREEKNLLTSRLSTSAQKTILKVGGWAFSFEIFINEYWVEFTNGYIGRYFAPDKTSLRSCLYSVNRIIEVTKPKQLS